MFGTLVMPTAMPSDDVGTGSAKTNPVEQSEGGAFDALGDEQAKPGLRDATKTAIFHFINDAARVQFFRDIREWFGKKDQLFRIWDDDSVEWVYARLESIGSTRTITNRNHLAVQFNFEIYSPVWNGEYKGILMYDDGHYYDTGLYYDSGGDAVVLDSSPKTFSIENGGNAVQTNLTIKVTAGSANITNIKIEGNGAEIQFSGTINSTKELVIDCGAYTVENNGVDAIADFERLSSHSIEEWFILVAGSNSITVTITGGSTDSEIDFDYYDAHA